MAAAKFKIRRPPFPEIPGERFRIIPGWPDYATSTDGQIWSSRAVGGRRPTAWRKLKPAKDKDGYLKVILCGDDRRRRYARVHMLVLETFVGPRPAGLTACHDPDPTRSNCALANLRWDSQQNNCRDKVKHGTAQRGVLHGRAILTESKVKRIRRRWLAGRVTQTQLAAEHRVSISTVNAIIKRRLWKHVA